MKPPAEELERRRPVWEAMSAVFLDNEVDDEWREKIVMTLHSSGYSDSELDHTLWAELCPVLHVNLQNMAGEWAGFDMEHVEQQIIARPAGRVRQWWAYLSGGGIARHEWRKIKQSMTARHAT